MIPAPISSMSLSVNSSSVSSLLIAAAMLSGLYSVPVGLLHTLKYRDFMMAAISSEKQLPSIIILSL